MRILYVASNLNARAGGTTSALAGIALAQAKAGLDVSILTTWRTDDDLSIVQRLTQAGINIIKIGPARGPLSRHPDLRRAVNDAVLNADIVHIQAVWEEAQHQAARASVRHRVPYVVTPHGMLTTWSLAQKSLKKRLYLAWRLKRDLEAATAVHFVSDMERDLSAHLGLRVRTIVEPIGLDASEFKDLPPRGTFRRRYDQLAESPYIVFLGRIHPGKGLEYLVPAIARMAQSKAKLVIVGPDSHGYRAVIEAEIRRLGLADRVIFAGMLQHLDRLAVLAEADLFCLPSDHENFGLAAIESLAAGTPVILSDQVAVARQIAAAGAGAIAPREPAGLAAVLDQWLADPLRCQSVGKHARAFAIAQFDWDVVAGRWMSWYDAEGIIHQTHGKSGAIVVDESLRIVTNNTPPTLTWNAPNQPRNPRL